MKRNNTSKKLNRYPLCDAVIDDDMASFDALLEAGVDVDGTDYNGVTALWYASDQGRVEMAEKLLKRGADIEFRNCYGNTPLSNAVFSEKRYGVEMIHLLLSYGADVNAENNYGVSPKSLANTIAGFPKIDAFQD